MFVNYSNKTIKKLSLVLALTFSISYISACSSTTPVTPDTKLTDSSEKIPVTKETVVTNYTNIVYASYQDSLDGIKKLQEEINKFVANPTQEGLESAKNAWLKSRLSYGQTEGYRFADGPIDRENGPEVRINSWPLDEVFIDYVDGNKSAGIINDTKNYPEINKSVLSELNQKGGDKNISVGFHAVEFLLWGQDLTDGPGAGQRQYTDYLTDGKGTNENQARRGKYLTTLTDLLVEDIKSLVNEWDTTKANNYVAEFKKMNVDQAITNILKGVGTLSASELSNQRMATPLEIGEREEEHSCFSDSTQSDLLQNTKSIQNVLLGTYTKADGTVIKGPGVYELIQPIKPDLATKLKTQLDTSIDLVTRIKSPFDQEIRPDNKEGNTRVSNAVKALQEQGVTIVDIGSALGLTINTKL